MKFRFIEEQREIFPVGQLCNVLKVSRSGFYASRKRPPSARARDNESLAQTIHRVHRENRGVYGSPRVYRALQRAGIAAGTRRGSTSAQSVHHSDRAFQYGGAEYQDLLDRHGIRSSMSRAHNCWDNALAESFFHTIKTEWLYHFTFDSRAQARSYIFDYIECFYNRSRLHSSLGYRSPITYETDVCAA